MCGSKKKSRKYRVVYLYRVGIKLLTITTDYTDKQTNRYFFFFPSRPPVREIDLPYEASPAPIALVPAPSGKVLLPPRSTRGSGAPRPGEALLRRAAPCSSSARARRGSAARLHMSFQDCRSGHLPRRWLAHRIWPRLPAPHSSMPLSLELKTHHIGTHRWAHGKEISHTSTITTGKIFSGTVIRTETMTD